MNNARHRARPGARGIVFCSGYARQEAMDLFDRLGLLVAIAFEHGYALVQAMIARGGAVI
jgi:hypothetical protein